LTGTSDRDVARLVEDCWGLGLDQFEYLPEGGGAYHWIALTTTGEAWFVTCDDLDTKPWLGSDRDSAFTALTVSYTAAMEIRDAGAHFIVAPVMSRHGAPTERLDDRHAVACLTYIEGEPWRWGQGVAPSDRD
jgi:hypothetical protein